ncbi:hypothetical protein EK904_014938 [Melospiza melodia maxima]|nr:hypothetical protein EK904_014938 [Melospiza melodia maxima]
MGCIFGNLSGGIPLILCPRWDQTFPNNSVTPQSHSYAPNYPKSQKFPFRAQRDHLKAALHGWKILSESQILFFFPQNLEMHDRIEHLIEKQVSRGGSSARARSKSEYVSSKRLPGPKPLPLIRVVET